jgi:hypothetical protein
VKRTPIDMSDERRILSWMIASDVIFQHVHTTYDSPRLFESSFARTVATWIHGWAATEPDKSPGTAIQDLYASHAKSVHDEEDTKTIALFLGNLSKDWTHAVPTSDAWAREQADKYFRLQRCKKALELANRAAESGDVDAAESALLSFSRPLGSEFETYDLFRDDEAILDAYTSSDEVLFHMPGALGEMLGPIIAGDFLGILAPQKRGKSFMVDLFAIAAVKQGVDVLLVDFEMTKRQKARRLWGHYIGQPHPRDAGIISVPCFGDRGDIGYRNMDFRGVELDREKIARIQKGGLRLNQGATIQWMNVPNRGATVRQIKHRIKELRKGREQPFLAIFDSGDYLRAEDTRQPRIEQLDEIWGAMRGVSQEFERCACLSPSHTGRQTSKGEGTDSDVSGDIRKLWKLTKTVYLNRTKAEAEAGIIRCSTETLRDGPTRNDQVVVLQNLTINRPYLDSRWLREVHSDLVYSGSKKSDLDP